MEAYLILLYCLVIDRILDEVHYAACGVLGNSNPQKTESGAMATRVVAMLNRKAFFKTQDTINTFTRYIHAHALREVWHVWHPN